jgi:hypothetical protein
MNTNPWWTTPEAEAYFENTNPWWTTPETEAYFEATDKALNEAIACEKLWRGLCSWLETEPDQVAAYVGKENYKTFVNLVYTMLLLSDEAARIAKKNAVA